MPAEAIEKMLAGLPVTSASARMSHHLRGSFCPEGLATPLVRGGNVIPVRVDEPRERSIEPDRAAIADRRRPDACDIAPQNTAANICMMRAGFHMQLHSGAGKQAACRFDERAACRDVDDPRRVTGPDADGEHAVVFEAVAAAGASSVVCDRAHSGFHCPVRRWYFRMRVLPVWP